MKLIPNLLSGSRLAMAPYLFFLLWRRQYGLALALIFIAGVTDGLDGYAARKLGGMSRLGAYLDPIADKVLLSGAFLTLAIDGAIETWLAILVLGRDVLILLVAAGMYLFTSIRSFPPSFPGKASTTAQIIFIVVLLMHFAGFLSHGWVATAEFFVVAWAIVSIIDYAIRAVKMKA